MDCKSRKGYWEHRKSFYDKLPENIVPVSEYISWQKPISVRCTKCGEEHTYPQAKYAVIRKCHGCYLNEIREASKEKLLPILEENDFQLVAWAIDSKIATIKCKKCGMVCERNVGDVINHSAVHCFECQKQRTINHSIHRKRQQKGKESERKETRKEKMSAELDKLISGYVDDYDIVSIDENLRDLVLRHKQCGHEFNTNKERLKKGYGCKICSKRGVSKAVQEIENYFDNVGIEYEREKRFDECRRKNPLPFDFYIPTLNLLIEYNGEQHYRATEYFGGEEKLRLYMERDEIKREFAKAHGYKLLTIPWFRDPVQMIKKELSRE